MFVFFDKNKDGQVDIEFRKMSLALDLISPDWPQSLVQGLGMKVTKDDLKNKLGCKGLDKKEP